MTDIKKPDADLLVDDTELAAAEAEAKTADNVYVHDFGDKPFTWEGKTYESLTFDFSGLTGEDSLAIENEMLSLGKALIVPEFSGEYLLRMAARACRENIGTDALKHLPMFHYNRIRSRARSFLLS